MVRTAQMTESSANHALQRLEPFGKWRKDFAGSKGFARCETETAGAVESTVPPVGAGISAFAVHATGPAWLSLGR